VSPQLPRFPSETKYFCDSKRVEIKFTHPIAKRQDGFQIVRFVRIKSGEIKIPMFAVQRPRYDSTNEVSSAMAWEPIIWALTGEQEYVFLPINSEIDTYIFLVRVIEGEDRSWRIWEASPTGIYGDTPELHMPRLKDMELLEAQPFGNELERKYEVVRKFSETLGTWVEN